MSSQGLLSYFVADGGHGILGLKFGPNRWAQFWELPRDPWGLPIEPLSSWAFGPSGSIDILNLKRSLQSFWALGASGAWILGILNLGLRALGPLVSLAPLDGWDLWTGPFGTFRAPWAIYLGSLGNSHKGLTLLPPPPPENVKDLP